MDCKTCANAKDKNGKSLLKRGVYKECPMFYCPINKNKNVKKPIVQGDN
jgi:hypothetical protein